MRLGWLTDIHLNYLDDSQCDSFLKTVSESSLDAILIGGDIAEGDSIESYLRIVADRVSCPVYFVLGNHDFYFSSFAKIKELTRALCLEIPKLHWLGMGEVVSLSDETALIGVDGWADGRDGDYTGSEVLMNDYFLISELADLDKDARLAVLNAQGDAAAAEAHVRLTHALSSHRRVILLTHAPPFREACQYLGQISADAYLPHLSCRAVGDVLREIMRGNPEKHLQILCGHTHSECTTCPAPNIMVKTGGAEYGGPVVQEVISI